jgi:hypothetical protein
MSALYFLHLYNCGQVLRDEIGVEFSALDRVSDLFAQTMKEMQREEELKTSEVGGWEVRVADATGTVVETFRLTDLKH